jgi:hypothetical protein
MGLPRVTDLSNTLSESEKQLLDKGPKFRIADKLDSKSLLDIRTNFCRFVYQYRWKKTRDDNVNVTSTDNEIPIYPRQDHIYLPPVTEESERKINRMS